MGQSFTRTEKMIGLIALVLVAGFVGVFSLVNKASKFSSKNFDSNQRINYKMARPESPYSEYTIEGREVDQVYEGLEPAQVAEIKAKKKAEKVAAVKKEVKKKEEAKKQAAKKQAQAVQAAQNKQRAQQLAAAKVQPLPKETKKSNNSNDNSYSPVYAGGSVNQEQPLVVETTTKTKKTYAEWRSLIFDNPNSDSLTQFITAFRKNEVTATEFQAMAQDLLDQEDSKYKALGLQALRAVPSLNSLSQLVHVQSSLPASYQTYVDEALKTYFYPQNISYLSSALRTKDRTVITKVLNLLNVNLNRLNDGDQTVFVDSRNTRANPNVNITLNSFSSLVPALNAIVESQDPEFAGIAQQIASLIGTTNNVAQN